MERHLDQELNTLQLRLLEMGAMAEDMLEKAVRSVLERDELLARRVRRLDDEVDAIELEIDEMCLRLLGLRQPVASDLRFVVTAMRVNSDLERIADQARNIAKHSRELASDPPLKPFVDLPRTAELVQEMIRESLDALVKRDAEKAQNIIVRDIQMDDTYNQVFRELLTYMLSDPTTIKRALNILMIFRNLERIADHATNVCEDIVFMVEGRVIKHQHEERKPDTATI